MSDSRNAGDGIEGAAGDDINDREILILALRSHGQIKVAEDVNAQLGPGQTHLLIERPDGRVACLLEKRKSLL